MVTVRGWCFFSILTYFTRNFRSSHISHNGHRYSIAAIACCYSTYLFIALSLQADVIVLQPVTLLPCGDECFWMGNPQLSKWVFLDGESPALQRWQSLFSLVTVESSFYLSLYLRAYTAVFKHTWVRSSERIFIMLCDKCPGVGKLDWLGISLHWSGSSHSTEHHLWVSPPRLCLLFVTKQKLRFPAHQISWVSEWLSTWFLSIG